eukprot:gnl/MRDRNA2_/MRDRNA2_83857_c1_seq7.p1 gnl/MRDRNA2_/MRDRNA2_83857_c1~~gnl/MRDRNA2_/MRDRNA2_83857_c1_seq7.p1  ORF type:complete len:391 (+),score=88.73 gnl/MRDRNA2_/MRDRNA2_83857_c1_seq7:143-1174(+)
MLDETCKFKDFFDNLGLTPLEGSLTDASTVDSGASTGDSDSEPGDGDWRTLAQIGKTQSNFDAERRSGGSFHDYLALHEKVESKDGDGLRIIWSSATNGNQRAVSEKKLWTQTYCIKANLAVQMFLNDVWKRKWSPPSDLAKQVHKMLLSNKIALSPETYQLMVHCAVDDGYLSMATDLSFEMERQTGAVLPQDMLDKMHNLELWPEMCQEESDMENLSGGAGTQKDEIIATLMEHPWYCTTQSRSDDIALHSHGHKVFQTHQVFLGKQNKVSCLTMTGDASPKFDQFELIWTGTTFNWGADAKCQKRKKFLITLTSTCAEIEGGVVTWAKENGMHSTWHASQ